MYLMKYSRRNRRAFTLIELVTVIVILGILSAVALPVYLDYRTDAKAAACKGALGGARAAVANFYAHSSLSGTATYPTLAELTKSGVVLTDAIPENPYDNSNKVAEGKEKGTITGDGGWAYKPSTGEFWANTSTAGENSW